jgi:hypothetical protein
MQPVLQDPIAYPWSMRLPPSGAGTASHPSSATTRYEPGTVLARGIGITEGGA